MLTAPVYVHPPCRGARRIPRSPQSAEAASASQQSTSVARRLAFQSWTSGSAKREPDSRQAASRPRRGDTRKEPAVRGPCADETSTLVDARPAVPERLGSFCSQGGAACVRGRRQRRHHAIVPGERCAVAISDRGSRARLTDGEGATRRPQLALNISAGGSRDLRCRGAGARETPRACPRSRRVSRDDGFRTSTELGGNRSCANASARTGSSSRHRRGASRTSISTVPV